MQLSRSLAAIALVGIVAVGCGGAGTTQAPAGATQQPAATTDGGGGGTATEVPAVTQPGDGGGGGGTGQYGSVTFTISGPFDKTATFDFLPAGSMFGGTQGSVMNFTNGGDGSSGSVLSIVVDQGGKVIVSYVGTEGQVPAAECTTSDWNLQAQSGSGKFDCTAAMSITGSGAAVQGGKITGQFSAHT